MLLAGLKFSELLNTLLDSKLNVLPEVLVTLKAVPEVRLVAREFFTSNW